MPFLLLSENGRHIIYSENDVVKSDHIQKHCITTFILHEDQTRSQILIF